ncbi:MAG: hypothetical protein ACRD8Z_23240, partial [Nitrososphaeraceae archaeon]
VQGQQVSPGTLSIKGVSTDNSISACEVYIILNEIRPYQKVNPTGSKNKDYSTWNYAFTPEYATIKEGNNRMVSKITCMDNSDIKKENLTKFNSLNVTGIGIVYNATNSELLSLEAQESQPPTNTTYNPDIRRLQDLGTSNPKPDNDILNYLQSTGILDEIQFEEDGNESNDFRNEDNDIDDQDADYSSSSNSGNDDGERDEKDFIEELHDRVLDQVAEQLRESGIDFPQ